MTGYHETNFSMAYSSHISWQSADSPVPNEVYPSLAFDSLFENRGSLRNQSILDRVKDRADEPEPPGQRDRQGQAGRVPDQRARGREARRAHARGEGQRRRSREAQEPPGVHDGTPGERPARGHARAHAADVRHHRAGLPDRQDARSRRCCCAATCPSLFYPFLDVRDGHHGASHDDLSDGYERISRFHLSQLAYLAAEARRDARRRGHGARQLAACCSCRTCGPAGSTTT